MGITIMINKNVLVTGANGMIGKRLVELLEHKRANVYTTDLPNDLRDRNVCEEVCKGMDIVFHLAGIKGSPQRTMEQPASFSVPMIQFNANMIEAAYNAGVEWFLYTSSVGVYHPSEVFKEDDVWKTFPSEHDWNRCSIVRPANVYGIDDDFGKWSMVIPSLIKKAYENDKLEVWGDGSPIRDLIYAEDVAHGMIHMVENKVTEPVNLASGTGVTIKEIAEIISKYFGKEIVWDTTKPMGDMKRLMDTSRAESYGFKPEVSLEDGIIRTIKWYEEYLAKRK
jgi:GDP-L-fucose synthase